MFYLSFIEVEYFLVIYREIHDRIIKSALQSRYANLKQFSMRETAEENDPAEQGCAFQKAPPETAIEAYNLKNLVLCIYCSKLSLF